MQAMRADLEFAISTHTWDVGLAQSRLDSLSRYTGFGGICFKSLLAYCIIWREVCRSVKPSEDLFSLTQTWLYVIPTISSMTKQCNELANGRLALQLFSAIFRHNEVPVSFAAHCCGKTASQPPPNHSWNSGVDRIRDNEGHLDNCHWTYPYTRRHHGCRSF